MLSRFRDADLTPQQESGIWSHLKECDTCRFEYRSLCDAAGIARSDASPSPQMLTGLLGEMRRWKATHALTGDALKRRVLKEVAPFLGHRAAGKIMQPVAEDCHNLLSIIEPVLAQFLGNRAASELVSHIVDVAIVRV